MEAKHDIIGKHANSVQWRLLVCVYVKFNPLISRLTDAPRVAGKFLYQKPRKKRITWKIREM